MRMIKQKIQIMHTQEGTTLVEVLLAVVILAVVIVGSIALFAKCSVFAEEIKEHSIVNNALNERMEEIRDMPYNTILGLGTSFTAAGFTQLDNTSGTMTLEDTFSDSDIRKVNLVINWSTAQGRAYNKSLSAYVTNTGINKQ